MSKNWNWIAEKIQAVMDEEVALGRECGCQMVIYEKGEKVLDLVAGYTSSDKKEKVDKNHLFPIFSCGKAVLAAAALQGLDKGYYTIETPLAQLWKGFEANGKGDITVEHALSHRAGLHLLPPFDTPEEFADWDLMCRKMAEAVPETPAGKKINYHGITFAYLVGRPLELVYKRPLKEILKKEIIERCGAENDLFFGTDEDAEKRVVPIVDDEAIENRPSWCAIRMNNPLFRKVCIPSFNGCATADGLAKFYAALAGDLPHAELVKQETLAFATKGHFRNEDDILPPNAWCNFGLGLVLREDYKPGLFGHGGACGSEGYYVKGRRLAVAFVKNRTIKGHPNHIIRDRISEILELPIRHW